MNKIFSQQSDHPLFRYFTDEERQRIEKIGEVKRIAEGGYLIRASEIDSTLFAVEGGHLDIVGSRDGRPAVVATVGPGDVLGEVAFIDDSPRSEGRSSLCRSDRCAARPKTPTVSVCLRGSRFQGRTAGPPERLAYALPRSS